MSNDLRSAFVESIRDSFDPMNGVIRQHAAQLVEEKSIELTSTRANAIAQMEQQITAAKNRGADESVIMGYQKLLAKLTA